MFYGTTNSTPMSNFVNSEGVMTKVCWFDMEWPAYIYIMQLFHYCASVRLILLATASLAV